MDTAESLKIHKKEKNITKMLMMSLKFDNAVNQIMKTVNKIKMSF